VVEWQSNRLAKKLSDVACANFAQAQYRALTEMSAGVSVDPGSGAVRKTVVE